MLQRTEGIVLKTDLFAEADLIVTYITKDCGIVKTFAKSPRKIKEQVWQQPGASYLFENILLGERGQLSAEVSPV